MTIEEQLAAAQAKIAADTELFRKLEWAGGRAYPDTAGYSGLICPRCHQIRGRISTSRHLHGCALEARLKEG